MSQIAEIEGAWHDLIASIAAKSGTASGVATAGTARSVSCDATGWSAVADYWQWAVVAFTSGDNAGRWRVAKSYANAAGTVTLGWHQALPVDIEAGDQFSVDFAPLGGATVFRRRVPPQSIALAEMPAIFVATQRSRTLTPQATGRAQGSRLGRLEVRTDLITPWDETAAQETVAMKLFEQLDQIRLVSAGLPGVAHLPTPTRTEQIAGLGELDAGQRVHWSTMWTPLEYNV